ncbi:TIGR02453 family protein [Pseudohoeflea suaedae]|uniref:TIGR02453 family protein n=1 Tax=Pseudohoeflea suaedae TaxID=877384 RepID=A0A4R5PPT4_9HYPH|nr:TIGR02453 family protein [Pseudohoeflea suaedae]TDH39029.1 TIGR02453 family protein [Pseudohoeflea suaedae]
MTGSAYSGFGPQTLPFLKALGFHQNREWFEDNREIYETELREPLAALMDDIAARFADEDIPLTCSAKQSIFRINRDVRFSRNKEPYKTNLGAIVTRSGAKKDPGLLYINIAPDNCFVGAGFYRLEGEELRAFREAIIEKPGQFRAAVAPLTQRGHSFIERDMLKRPPRGFEGIEDPETLELLKLKHIALSRPFEPDMLNGRALIDEMVDVARAALPLLEFGWRIVDPFRAAAGEVPAGRR